MATIFADLIQALSSVPCDASLLERSISALDKAITAKDISTAGWERWLPAFAFWVALGVVVEFWVLSREFSEDRAAWRLGIIRYADRPSVPRFVLELLGVLLVAAGVALEFWGGFVVAQVNGELRFINGQLRNKSTELVACLDGETQQAMSAAGSANARAAKLDLENTRLQAIVQPRTIDPVKQQKIADSCGQFQGRYVMVESYGLDAEAFAFGEQVIATLNAIPGTVVRDGRASFATTGKMESGVHIRTGTYKSEVNFAFCLTTAFKVIGGVETTLNDPQPQWGSMTFGGRTPIPPANTPFVTVMIGVKPLPLLTDKTKKTNNTQTSH